MTFLIITILLSIIILLLSLILTKTSFNNKEMSSPFECGFDPFSSPRSPFSLRFFKITIVFLIFDVEIVLLLPMILTKIMSLHFVINSSMAICIIMAGLIYEWKTGSINWLK
uniref:NADH-ubiquinone oxidoreductase chain 3 n=1 Tax=Microdiplogynium sp. XFX TaxID=2695875 RepID=A0A6B9WCG1_9ACAR|nr:NADH dehydrogenase subunit 3 [Microdiplogynium sp. XFX]